ncbi:hypothetical protein IP92_01516 [Pseudoduganella flava]|uniref:TerB family tellurite resistance protein n=1 Tax=Pseudoduganella flava TaxID=871742 RepID=A0A562Q0U5_9BURK|nr:TerB family tellurite resistance protein [Pseudoduganella flava]QGZ38188.1 TerB family tellurite resistance protein [Pseudoduganella flava]TWI50287.1 hypothetical protein IP92_01516 [Pseudoduganella flava]
MRTYEANSPRACARLLALAMVVDGDLDPAELEVLEDGALLRGLGLDGAVFQQVLGELCTDLLRTAVRDGAVEIKPALLDRLLAEITDPALQQRLLAAMVTIVDADSRVEDAEGILLEQACVQWKPDLALLKQSTAAA